MWKQIKSAGVKSSHLSLFQYNRDDHNISDNRMDTWNKAIVCAFGPKATEDEGVSRHHQFMKI